MRSMRTCDHCKVEFIPVKPTRRYCSKRCSNLARWDAGVYGPRYEGSEPWHVDHYRRNADKLAKRSLDYYHAHPEKQKARIKARRNTPVLPCEVDGCGKPGDRHHDDYARPLDVRYLCRSHHIAYHKRLERERVA